MFQAASTSTSRKRVSSLRDQIQVALALADRVVLTSLLVHSKPALAKPQAIGALSVAIGVPLPPPESRAVDGVLEYEAIRCVLVAPELAHRDVYPHYGDRDYLKHLRLESDLHTLAEGLTATEVFSVLGNVGFPAAIIERMLHLPPAAYHQSWWSFIDEQGNEIESFLRSLRLVRYANGLVAIRYRDRYQQHEPLCFRGQKQQVIIKTQPHVGSFCQTLAAINRDRHGLGIARTLLIADSVSDFVAQGLISQGISLYPATDLSLPLQSDCARCTCHQCALRGTVNSPVRMCRNFQPLSSEQ